MATKGIDVRQTTGQLVFRVSLKDPNGAKVTSGTTELRVYRLEDDGTLDVYDWTTNDFVAPGAGTPDDETTMTHRQRRDSTGADVDTGIWTAVLSTLTNWTAGQVYVIQITNTAASPESQEREFQFGLNQGDDLVTTILADTNELQTDWVDDGRLDVIQDAILSNWIAMFDFDSSGAVGAADRISWFAAVGAMADWINNGRLDLILDAIPDDILARAVQNVEDSADKHSLGAMVMISTNSSISGTTLTAKKPSNDSVFQTYTVVVSAGADPIIGIS